MQLQCCTAQAGIEQILWQQGATILWVLPILLIGPCWTMLYNVHDQQLGKIVRICLIPCYAWTLPNRQYALGQGVETVHGPDVKQLQIKHMRCLATCKCKCIGLLK